MTEKSRRERARDWAPALPAVVAVVVLAFMVDEPLGAGALLGALLALVAVVL